MGRWPFVGREAELGAITSDLVDRRDSALLLGEPGVGKTRLAQEALARCQQQRRQTDWVAATAATAGVPLGAVAHLLPVAERGETAPRGELFRRVAAQLDDRTAKPPLVLGIDDAHNLDDGSSALVHHLAAIGSATLLVTARAGERLPDPIMAMRRSGSLSRHQVDTLGDDAVGHVLEQALGGQVAATTVRRLAEACGGNALYLRELVADGIDSGLLAPIDGVWRWSGQLTAHRLGELLDERLDGLDQPARQALEHLAFGEPLTASLLAVVEPDADLETLERRSLVTVSGGAGETRVALAHPIYADVLRSSVPSWTASRIRSRLADALERVGTSSDQDLLRLATWRLEAGEGADPALLVSAGYQAKAAEAYRLAERLARAAAEVAGNTEHSKEARWLLATTVANQGRVTEAEEILAQLEAEAGTVERAELAATTALEQFWLGGQVKAAERTLRRAGALAELGGDRAVHLGVVAAGASFLSLTGTAAQARAAAEEVLSSPEANEVDVLRAAIASAMANALAGCHTAAIEAIDRGLPLAPRQIELQPVGVDLLLANRSLTLRLNGNIREALAGAEHGYRASLEGGEPGLAHPLWLLALGQAGVAKGTIDDALRWLREAAMWLGAVEPNVWLSWCLATLAQALGMAGDHTQASEAAAQARDHHDPRLRTITCDLLLAQAWALAAGGDVAGGAASCLEAAEAAEDLGQHALAVAALGEATRLGALPAAAERLRGLEPHVEGGRATTLLDYAEALAARDAARLERAADALSGMGAELMAAEAWAEIARLHHAAGRRASASTATAKGQALAARCRGAATPMLLRLSGESLLTRREREVASLAAQGLPNREIAERLHVSLRTVENHLHNIYGKLGVGGRDELALLLAKLTDWH